MKNEPIYFEKTVEGILSVAEERRSRGDLEGAASAYREALKIKPFHYEANAGLGSLYYDAGLIELGLNCWYHAFFAANGKTEHARAANGVGAGYYFLGDDESAVINFSSQLLTDGETEFEYNDVIYTLRDAVSETMNREDFHLLNGEEEDEENLKEGVKLISERRFTEGVSLLQRIGGNSSLYLSAQENILISYVYVRRYDWVLSTCNSLISNGHGSFYVYYSKALAELGLGQVEGAKQTLGVLQTGEFSAQLDENAKVMALLILKIGYDDQAEEYAKKVLRAEPYDPDMLYIKGLACYNTGRAEECADALRTILCFQEVSLVRERLRLVTELPEDRPARLTVDHGLMDDEGAYLRGVEMDLFATGELRNADKIKQTCSLLYRGGSYDFFADVMSIGLSGKDEEFFSLVTEVLVDFSVPQRYKAKMLAALIKSGVSSSQKVLCGYEPKEIQLMPVTVMGENARFLNDLYARVAGYVYVIDEDRINSVIAGWADMCEGLDESDLDGMNYDSIVSAVLSHFGLRLDDTEREYFFPDADEDEVEEACAALSHTVENKE